MICDSILDAVGHTPLVRLRRMVTPDMAEVLVKFEALNVGGSIKTRTALNMIRDAEARGLLKPDSAFRALVAWRFLPQQYPSRRKFVIMSPYNRSNESMFAGRELTFVVFMMHLLAVAWSLSPSEAYALCK